MRTMTKSRFVPLSVGVSVILATVTAFAPVGAIHADEKTTAGTAREATRTEMSEHLPQAENGHMH